MKKRWPVTIIVALVIGWLAMLIVIGVGAYWIIVGWGGPWGSLTLLLWVILIAPAAIVAVMAAWMLTRARWSRVAYSLSVAAWTLLWASFFRSGALPVLIAVPPTGVLIVSAGLTWLPASRSFFDESARVEVDDPDEAEAELDEE